MSEIPQQPESPRHPHIELGKDRHPIPYMERTRSGQEHKRYFAYVENAMRDKGENFSFAEELKSIAHTFKDALQLTILDGGCGEGNMLQEIEEMKGVIGKQIETVGVTLEDHPSVIESLGSKDIDEVYIGGMKEFVEKNGDRKFHFIIDSSGYAYHDEKRNSDGSFSQGENIIPLYAQMLVPGGKAFLTLGIGNEAFYGKKSRENLMNLLERNNLSVLKETKESGYYLVEKIEPSAVSS